MDKEEQNTLRILDEKVRQQSVSAVISSVVLRVERKLMRDGEALLAWESVPLAVYGERLPDMIRSSWVFILRALANTRAERHPNSHQRMMSYRGSGDLQIRTGESVYSDEEREWRSNHLVSDPEAPIQNRWISIPPSVWHRAIVPEENWIVVSFHTATEDELVEERPDATSRSTHQRRYLDI